MIQADAQDVVAWATTYQGEPFHAVLCDPPYELGFMGKDWDRSGVAFNPDTWRAIASVLHPGAFLMAFASSRGWHRLAVAIEDAGLVIHPSIFGWAFGSGFPKATRLDTQIDAAAGAEREAIAQRTDSDSAHLDARRYRHGTRPRDYSQEVTEWTETAPATDEAKAWAGHRYGLQALKPALEPIIVAQVPYEGRPVDSITETGAGAIDVDGGRIAGAPPSVPQPAFSREMRAGFGASQGRVGEMSQASGRWPANLTLTHRPECRPAGTRRVATGIAVKRNTPAGQLSGRIYPQRNTGIDHTYADADGREEVEAWACADGCPVAELDRQSGDSVTPATVTRGVGTRINYSGQELARDQPCHGDSGGASRFFHRAAWELEHAERVRYVPKASTAERDAGLDGPLQDGNKWSAGGIGARRREAGSSAMRNPHPTVKPIALAEWLARLLLPPAAYAPRRILVPFAGVGSEMIGALRAGWEHVHGVELQAEHVAIAEDRIRWWSRYGDEAVEAWRRSEQARAEREALEGQGQRSLF